MKRTVSVLCLVLLLCVAACGGNASLNGKWWNSQSSDSQVEFIAGFIDCYSNDFGDKNNAFQESGYQYAPRITSYYEQHPEQIARPVTKVLFEVRSSKPPKPLEWRNLDGKTWVFQRRLLERNEGRRTDCFHSWLLSVLSYVPVFPAVAFSETV